MWDTVFVGSDTHDTHTVCVEQCGWEEGERKQESCTRVEVGLEGRRGTYGVERERAKVMYIRNTCFNGFYQHDASVKHSLLFIGLFLSLFAVLTLATHCVSQSSKPIMEKRRRARINASLAELKSLLLEVIKKEVGHPGIPSIPVLPTLFPSCSPATLSSLHRRLQEMWQFVGGVHTPNTGWEEFQLQVVRSETVEGWHRPGPALWGVSV